MNPTVSIIIPNYNHAPYLKDRIESVLNQTYEDYEIIILDDNSTDSSREIIEKYRMNPKVSHIIYNDENSGSTFKQWERGINLAKGELIWIAESDDVAEDELLSSLVPFFNDPLVGIGFCASKLIDQNSEELAYSYDNIFKERLSKDNIVNIFDCVEFRNQFMISDNYIYNASAVLFKKSLWNKINKSFTGMKSCGDWMCWLFMLENSKKIVRYNKELNKFRIHSNKVTTKSSLDGRLYSERLLIVNYLYDRKNISFLKKSLIIGWGYFKIDNSELNEKLKKSIIEEWKSRYPFRQFYKICYFLFNKVERIKMVCWDCCKSRF